MSEQIPVSAVASQRLSISLNGQNFRINLYQLDADMYIDLLLNDTPIISAHVVRNLAYLLRDSRYRGVDGDFIMVDTQGDEPPQYTGLNDRWFFLYVPDSELFA